MGDHSGKNRVVSDNVIMALAQELDDAGTFVGRSLGLSDPAIGCIQKDHQGNLKEINYQILLKWKRQSGSKATKARLALALRKCHRTDLVERYLKDSNRKKETVKAVQSTGNVNRTKQDKKKVPSTKRVSALSSSAKKGTTKGAQKKAKSVNSSKNNKDKTTAVSKRGETPAGLSAKKGTTKVAEKKAKSSNSSKDNKAKKISVSKRGETSAGSSAQKTTTKRKSTTKIDPPKGPKQQKVPAKKATSAQKSRQKKEPPKRGSTSKNNPPKDSEEKLFAEFGRAVLEQAVMEQLADTSY